MKRVLTLLVLALFFTGCQKTIKSSYYYYPSQVNLDTYQNLDFIKVKQGKTMTVVVEDNPSTGYQWSILSQNSCAVDAERGNTQSGSSDGMMVGVPGTLDWVISGKEAGSCLIEFVHTSPSGDVSERKGIYFIVD